MGRDIQLCDALNLNVNVHSSWIPHMLLSMLCKHRQWKRLNITADENTFAHIYLWSILHIRRCRTTSQAYYQSHIHNSISFLGSVIPPLPWLCSTRGLFLVEKVGKQFVLKFRALPCCPPSLLLVSV